MKNDFYSIFLLSGGKPSHFSKWLAEQCKRDDPIGDLAWDARHETDSPWKGQIPNWKSHLVNSGASNAAKETLKEAIKEYKYSGHGS